MHQNMTRYSTILLLISLLLAATMIGCGKSGDEVLAKIGSDKITVQDFERLVPSLGSQFESAQDEFDKRRTILDSIIVTRLLVQAAYDKGLDNLEAVARAMSDNRDRFLLEALYDKHVASLASATDAEVREGWDFQGSKVRALHILTETEDSANVLFEQLKSGVDFEQLAYECSMDPSARNNRGDLGYFTWGAMDEDFERAVFAMEVGEISPPVKSPFGYHLIKLVDKTENELRESFADAKAGIKNLILNRKRQRLTRDYFSGIDERYAVNLDTTIAEYVIRKREQLYPPQLLPNIPKNDFDDDQLDRNEQELILATWNGGQISLIEYLERARTQLPPANRPNFDNYEGLKGAISNIVRTDILVQEAISEGLESSEMYQWKTRIFKEYSMADVMRSDSLPKPVKPTEEDIRAYYDQNQAEFTIPGAVHLYEILISDEMQAQRLAKEVRSLKDFQSKAAELTERPGYRAKKGDLGFVQEKYFPELFRAAFNAPKNKVGGPIRTMQRYSVFYPVDRRPAMIKDFLTVKADIVLTINSQRARAIFVDWVAERKSITDIEVFDDALWSTVDREAYTSTNPETGETP